MVDSPESLSRVMWSKPEVSTFKRQLEEERERVQTTVLRDFDVTEDRDQMVFGG